MNVTTLVIPIGNIPIAVPLPLPEPSDVATFWFVFTLFFTRGFCKGFDQFIQTTTWFENLSYEEAWIAKQALNLLHHWYIGWFIWVHAEIIAAHPACPFKDWVVVYYIGFAILLDDLPDIPPRLRKIFEGYADWWKGHA